jgi:hypothetical protein
MSVALSQINPAAISSVPDLPADYLEEIKRRAATPEECLEWSDFRARLAQDLQELAGD